MSDSKNSNFYEDISTEIETFIRQKKYTEALALVKDELSMPYIPSPFESKFKKYFQQLLIKTAPANNNNNVHSKVTIERIKKSLISINSDENNYQILYYLQHFYKFNYQCLLDEIDFFLNINANNYIQKSLLLIELIKMNVPVKISVTKNNQKLTIIPLKYSFRDKNYYFFQEIAAYFRKQYFTSAPQEFQIAIHAINFIDLHVFPFQIHYCKKDEVVKIIQKHLDDNLKLSLGNLQILF